MENNKDFHNCDDLTRIDKDLCYCNIYDIIQKEKIPKKSYIMSKLNGSDIIIQDIGFSYLVRYLGSAFEIIKQPYPVELLKTQNDKKKVLIYSIHHLQKVIVLILSLELQSLMYCHGI